MLFKNTVTLDKESFVKLRDLIHEKAGIYFADSKVYLMESRLQRRLKERNFNNFEDYFTYLKWGASNNDEFTHLINAVTTNETYFYREPNHYDALIQNVLPILAANKLKPEIKIWSAGCSTGEEPYTIAMLISQNPACVGSKIVKIYASDISEQVLNAARCGAYTQHATRELPADLWKYFKETEKGKIWTINDKIKSMVQFMHVNLFDAGQLKFFQNIDIIFCRNVIIYFNDEGKRGVINNFYDALASGGYLFLGHSESLHTISSAFKLVRFDKALVYQKL